MPKKKAAVISPAKATPIVRRLVTINSPDRFDALDEKVGRSFVDHLTGLQFARTAKKGQLTLEGARNYVAELNAKKHLGHSDWRLPQRAELAALVADGKRSPATYDALAQDTQSSSYYWTDTPVPGYEDYFFVVDFGNGDVSNRHRSYRRWVRPVRSLSPSGQSSALGGAQA